MNFRKNISDNLSICLSLACILHCIALPLLIIILPTFSSFWINNENVHVILVILAIPISLFAMTKSLTKHHNYKCIFLAGLGLLMLVAAIFMHDIGSLGEHADVAHSDEEHGQDDDHHKHKGHSGIGETLETSFTVLGGLVLLGAHLLNIKLKNNPLQ